MKFICLLLLSLCILDAKIVVVTNKNSQIKALSKEIVQYLYLAKIDKMKNTKIKSVLSADTNLHNEFCNNILCKSESQYNSYWARLVFTGRKSISKKLEWQEILEALQVPNTIAYINKKDLTDEWRIVYEEN